MPIVACEDPPAEETERGAHESAERASTEGASALEPPEVPAAPLPAEPIDLLRSLPIRVAASSAYRDEVRASVGRFAACPPSTKAWEDFAERLHFVAGDFGDPATYRRLGARLTEMSARYRTGGNFLFYLATPPSAFGTIVRQLGDAGLAIGIALVAGLVEALGRRDLAVAGVVEEEGEVERPFRA